MKKSELKELIKVCLEEGASTSGNRRDKNMEGHLIKLRQSTIRTLDNMVKKQFITKSEKETHAKTVNSLFDTLDNQFYDYDD